MLVTASPPDQDSKEIETLLNGIRNRYGYDFTHYIPRGHFFYPADDDHSHE